MSKVKIIILIFAVLLMCTGVAYAGWSEQVQLNVDAKTAFTELSISEVQATGARVDAALESQAAIIVEDIAPGEKAVIEITFKNTGTIPIDIEEFIVSSISGYSNANKKKLKLTITAYVDGKKVLNAKRNVSKWKTNGTAAIRQRPEIPVLGTIVVRVELHFDKKVKKNDKNNNNLEDVSFILTPGYSRFNND